MRNAPNKGEAVKGKRVRNFRVIQGDSSPLAGDLGCFDDGGPVLALGAAPGWDGPRCRDCNSPLTESSGSTVDGCGPVVVEDVIDYECSLCGFRERASVYSQGAS